MNIVEDVFRITVDYHLPADLGALLLLDFGCVDLPEYLAEIDGVDEATLFGATDGTTVIRVEILANDDPDNSRPTTELVREWVRGRIENVLSDTQSFVRHVAPLDQASGDIAPVFAAEHYAITYDVRDESFSLNWYAEGNFHHLAIDPEAWIIEEMAEIRERDSSYRVDRSDRRIDMWAEKAIRNAPAAAPAIK